MTIYDGVATPARLLNTLDNIAAVKQVLTSLTVNPPPECSAKIALQYKIDLALTEALRLSALRVSELLSMTTKSQTCPDSAQADYGRFLVATKNAVMGGGRPTRTEVLVKSHELAGVLSNYKHNIRPEPIHGSRSGENAFWIDANGFPTTFHSLQRRFDRYRALAKLTPRDLFLADYRMIVKWRQLHSEDQLHSPI